MKKAKKAAKKTPAQKALASVVGEAVTLFSETGIKVPVTELEPLINAVAALGDRMANEILEEIVDKVADIFADKLADRFAEEVAAKLSSTVAEIRFKSC